VNNSVDRAIEGEQGSGRPLYQPHRLNCSPNPRTLTRGIGLVLSTPVAAVFISALAFLVFCGCNAPKAQHGGRASVAGNAITLEQGENPQQPTTQITEEEIQRDFGIFAGAESFTNYFQKADAAKRQQVREYIKRKTQTSLGAAQKDNSREWAAKFANMKPVQIVGLLCVLVAGAFVYFKWFTPALIAGGTGIGLITFAHAVVGNERVILILLCASAAILAVFRSYEKGQLDHLLPQFLDKNKTPSNENEKAKTAK
jgi:hypothetical protein